MTKQKLPTSTAPVGAAATTPSDTNPDNLIPDPIVCAEFGVTAMTLWRWTHDTELNFPPAIAIRNRNFRSRRQLEALSRDTHPTSQLELGASLVGAFTMLMTCSPLVANPSHACDRAR